MPYLMALTETALNMEIKGFAKILALRAGVPYGLEGWFSSLNPLYCHVWLLNWIAAGRSHESGTHLWSVEWL